MTTPAARWANIKALFEATVELRAAAREPLITAAGLDADSLVELRSLLAHHDQITSGAVFMAEGAAQALAAAPAQAAATGQRLGAWEIVRPIGSGGMGEVFEARRADGSYEGRAAVKLLKRGMDSAAVLQRFAQERQALARLSHPHIARLLDAGASADGLPYFVLEYVQGQPIDEAVKSLTLDQRLRLFLQLADAVAHAHRNLLVHRDLKPGNVLVDSEGQVKLLDFGIAKALDPLESSEGNDGNTTVGGQRPYTPNYASPEQVRGEPVSTATDIYSLGVLLYQMLTGTRPTGRNATTPAEAARSVLEDAPTRPSRLSPTEAVDPQWLATRKKLEGDLDNILLKALEKQVERRYASVDALAADVHNVLSGRPVSARPASAGYVLAKFIGRHRLGTSLAALALATVLASGAYAAYQAQRAAARFDDLRELAHAVLFEYHDLIEPLVGATPVRKRLVSDALIYLDRLSRHAPADRALRREMGVAYRVIGLVQRNGYRRPHLGDTEGAMRSYEQAIAWLAPLNRSDPSDANTAYELALALSAQAAVLGEDGNTAQAVQGLQRAAALFTAQLPHDTPELYHHLELARTHLRRANTLLQGQDVPAAQAALDESTAVLQKMATLQPGHADLPHVWVWVQDVGSVIARRRGDWAAVMRLKLQSRDILLKLQAQDPDNARYLEDMAGAARWLLAAAGGQGDVDGIRRWGQEACDRYADLVRRDPEDRTTRGNQLDALLGSASQFLLAGAPAQAQARLGTVQAPLQAAFNRWPDDAGVRSREILLQVFESQLEQSLGKPQPALARLQDAANLAQALNTKFPNMALLQTNAAVVTFNRGKQQAALARAAPQATAAPLQAQARASLTAALAELQALLARRALVPEARVGLIDEARALLQQLDH